MEEMLLSNNNKSDENIKEEEEDIEKRLRDINKITDEILYIHELISKHDDITVEKLMSYKERINVLIKQGEGLKEDMKGLE